MRISPLFGLLAVALLVAGLAGVLLSDEAPALSVEAIRENAPIASTTTTVTVTTTGIIARPADQEPDVDSYGVAVADLGPTTTTVAVPVEAPSKTPSSNPAPPTTQPGVVATTTTAPPPVVESGPNADFESQFASRINAFRTSSGLSDLTRDGSLDSRARAWAERMADKGGLSHSDLGSLLPPWSAAGENVGTGGSVKSVFGALAGSSGHKANMLGDYTHFGTGVWVGSDGTIWTAHVFTR
jgi:uncharacterized protein YkwD